MSGVHFFMYPQKTGRIKYLNLVLGFPILLMYLFLQFVRAGILPQGKVLAQIYIYLPLAVMLVLSYHLIMKKNHSIEVRDNAILETDWRNQPLSRIKSVQIQSFRQNLLDELILLDKSGNKLLCVESNMTNFEQFRQWLARHNITQTKENDHGKSYF